MGKRSPLPVFPSLHLEKLEGNSGSGREIFPQGDRRNHNGLEEKMRIGIFPHPTFLGEVIPALCIGEELKKEGMEVIFLFHRGRYSPLIEEKFPFVEVPPPYKREEEIKLHLYHQGRFSFFKPLFSSSRLREFIEGEREVLSSLRLDAVIMFFQFTLSISARLLKIPLISVISGTWTAPFFEYALPPSYIQEKLPLPLPLSLKKKIFLKRFLSLPAYLKPFNQVAEFYNLPPFFTTLELLSGDLALVPEIPEIIGVEKDKMSLPVSRGLYWRNYPLHYRYIDPLEKEKGKETEENPFEIVSLLGSSTGERITRVVYQALVTLPHRSLLCLSSPLPSLQDRGKLRVTMSHPSLSLISRARLLIITGGRGTVGRVIQTGVPFIGIGIQPEQELRLELLARRGAGIRIPLSLLTPSYLRNKIILFLKEIRFRKKAEELSTLIPPGKNPAQIIRKFLKD